MRSVRALALASAGALVALSLTACAGRTPSDRIAVAGDTRVDLVDVAAPRLSSPSLDITAGFAKQAAPNAAKAKAAAAAAAAAAARRPMPAGVLATVTVRPGDTVRKGQVIAVFDETLLKLALSNAQAADRRNAASADALSAQASDLRDTRSTVRDQRAKLNDAMSKLQQGIDGQQQLTSAIAQLRAGIAEANGGVAQLAAARAQLAAKLAQAQKAASSPAPPPGIEKVVAKLKAQLAGIDAQSAKLQATVRQLNATLSGLLAKQAQLKALMPADPAAALAQLRSGKSQIASALSQIASGIDQLDSASTKVEAAQAIQSVGVEAAKAALEQAVVRAPCDGVVVAAMHTGEVPMIGAPVAVLRPSGDTLVDAYLTEDQVRDVRVGTPAEVSLDSMTGVPPGKVHDISADEEFPPSNYPTQIVHLSQVVRVTVSVPETLPAGVPCDVVIRP